MRSNTRSKRKSSTLKKRNSDFFPNIKTIHVINLDKDKTRFNSFTKRLSNLKYERWNAIYGKDLHPRNLKKLGIGTTTVMSGRGKYSEQFKDLRNLGAVGCFLSHRNLLNHLSFMNVPGSSGHLILEDDVMFLPDWSERWEKIRVDIPTDWDIVYLGMIKPIGEKINSNVIKLRKLDYNEGNWGTWAYLVRHESLAKKILPWLTYMIDAIDQQFTMKFDEWNAYCLDKSLVIPDKKLSDKSTIQTM